MTLGTPPPTDFGRAVPGLDQLARVATCLSPVPGSPGTGDSHFGGPLLWPADEPWPTCEVVWPQVVADDRWLAGHPTDEPPVPLVSAVQLFQRDVPRLPYPDGTDVLQVLLCPHDHNGARYWGPAVRLVWRAEAAVTAVLAATAVPAPPVSEDEDEGQYRPRPCVLERREIVEYPTLVELPESISSTLGVLSDEAFDADEDHDPSEHWSQVHQGSKVGGWAFWYQESPKKMGSFSCRDCGAGLVLLLSLATNEPDDGGGSSDAGWVFGRDGALNVFVCSADAGHDFEVTVD